MVLMSNAMHRAGLAGVPRRTADPTYEGFEFETAFGAISELRLQIALGGVILTLSLVLFFIHLVLSWFNIGETTAPSPVSIPEPLSGPENAPAVLENIRLWTGIAIALVLLTYVLPIASIVSGSGLFGQVEEPVKPLGSVGFLHLLLEVGRQLLSSVAEVVL
jgi:cytochrome c oxidase subunit 1